MNKSVKKIVKSHKKVSGSAIRKTKAVNKKQQSAHHKKNSLTKVRTVDTTTDQRLMTKDMKRKWYLGIGVIILAVFLINVSLISFLSQHTKQPVVQKPQESYWFMLYRKSNRELFYRGVPGNANQSKLIKTFTVKTGIPGERPTPLPQLVGREYWVLTEKLEQFDNPETAPYFLTLNIPVPSVEPYGPEPYTECNGQCNWMLPGAFGLHGTASDSSKLAAENPGSSGCIRHRDEDIAYLYNLLDPKREEIRYYVEDR